MSTLRSIVLGISSITLLSSIFFITYSLQRYETTELLSVYTLAFIAYVGCALLTDSKRSIYLLIGVAVVGRLILLPAQPNLSDDIYRFVWDGRLLQQNVNPFAYLPSELANGKADSLGIDIDPELYASLNSPDYYTIYPPINQAVFTLAVKLFPNSLTGSTWVIRAILLLAELGTLWLLLQLAKQYRIPPKQILWYALNPLVILEMTGNLHFEALMIFFLLGSVYLLEKQKWIASALLFALAVCTKLLPLMFLPLYLRRLGWQKALMFYTVVGVATLLLFLPLLSSELIAGLQGSIGLYFQKFEFNASLYYIVREIGYYRKGYNIIQTAGSQLAITAFLLIIFYTLLERKRRIIDSFGWVWLIYLLFALTVHPWYVLPLLALTVLTPYRYAVVWTYFIFLTYAGYTIDGFQENLWLVSLEYSVVLGWLGYELYRRRHQHLGVIMNTTKVL
ncbi:polyprenol phosphomannose-dependent alpha 1,6 mannosyltransferase MptB [Tunicatimonas pelagia]|uniref:polyprenol phosphomannose-dependent alpha 1,6 mannosyltransferase MptB n=1 Tax=Tunicatimonas pelagia TaxID=931531 RepID=UPI002666AC72|nr:polyprenol phosphomannose-dependent alpha 1,6 mannosyltransferase MptB [Tunicatimonas pelagia]WKN41505.1 polyprenol phosphomannose-dependent alpha 1,6 mannosyltransferase MptB [Tunicatimonas pelagia]